MKTLTGFMLSAMFGLFISLWVLNFAGTQAELYGVTGNMSNVLAPSLLNDSTSTSASMYADFQSSQSDQSSQITLFKNAPSVIKQQSSLGFRVFGHLFTIGQAQYVAIWAMGILLSIFIIYIVAMLLRTATGQTP